MKVRVLFFAKARDAAGAPELEVEVPDHATVEQLKTALATSRPALIPLLPRLHIAINSDYARDNDLIPAGAEVACFPPVSGG